VRGGDQHGLIERNGRHHDAIIVRKHVKGSVPPGFLVEDRQQGGRVDDDHGEWYRLYQWITLDEALALIADGMHFQPWRISATGQPCDGASCSVSPAAQRDFAIGSPRSGQPDSTSY